MAFEIRRVGDAADVLLFHELVAEYEAALPPDLRHGAPPDVRAGTFERTGATAAFIAFAGGHAGGCIAYRRLDRHTGLMMRLYVEPAHRGAGLARALVNHGLRFLRDAGCARAVLDTDAARLPEAVALYRSLGFTECEPYAPVSYANPTYFERALS